MTAADVERTRRRAADAATAVERLAGSLANGTADRVTIAYIMRLLEAAARVDEYTEHDRHRVEPDPQYLGRLRGYDPGYSANR